MIQRNKKYKLLIYTCREFANPLKDKNRIDQEFQTYKIGVKLPWQPLLYAMATLKQRSEKAKNLL